MLNLFKLIGIQLLQRLASGQSTKSELITDLISGVAATLLQALIALALFLALIGAGLTIIHLQFISFGLSAVGSVAVIFAGLLVALIVTLLSVKTKITALKNSVREAKKPKTFTDRFSASVEGLVNGVPNVIDAFLTGLTEKNIKK